MDQKITNQPTVQELEYAKIFSEASRKAVRIGITAVIIAGVVMLLVKMGRVMAKDLGEIIQKPPGP